MLRGIMVLPAASALSFPLLWHLLPIDTDSSTSPLASLSLVQFSTLGFLAGCGFMLAELPNSFFKRQLDISPGSAAQTPVKRWIFALIDRLDSTIGALLLIGLLIPLSALTWFWALIIGTGLHALFSALLYKTGVKDRLL